MKVMATSDESVARFERLIAVGIALSAERDHNRLMERILLEAKELSGADGGTLYLKTEDDRLRFAIMRTDSLGIAMGGTTGKPIPFPPLALVDAATGEPNHTNIATHVALTGATIAIPDAYATSDFDFSGTRKFDQGTGYRSKSFLTVPLKSHDGDVIGVLQLLNALDPETGDVVSFGGDIQPLIEALASQAAVALDNRQLIDAQRRLLDSFITLIASAIDAKSPYTGSHCQRVPALTTMLAEAACRSREEAFRDFDLTEDERYELHIAAWLHDCGKVTTPEYVVDKATKLETIHNRLHEIRTRFEVVKRDAEIAYLRGMAAGGDEAQLRAERDRCLAEIDDDYAFIAECNIGGEFMAPDKIERVKRIAATTWLRTLDDRLGLSHQEQMRLQRFPRPALPVEEPLLADKPEHVFERPAEEAIARNERYGFKLETPAHKTNLGEIYNLCVTRGTLTAEERYTINEHIVQTIVMLSELPFPKGLRRVPEYAGGHHETMIGTGYPRGLRREEMSLPARMMAIADIFEALTASDRPYKKAKTLSESLRIMASMRDAQHIDPDLFDLFLRSGIYRTYAETFLKAEQIDDVDIAPLMAGRA